MAGDEAMEDPIVAGTGEAPAKKGKRGGRGRIPAEPHMPAEAVEELKKRLYSAQCYLEYGTGGSTRLAARMKVPNIFSVESDIAFANAVKRAVKREGSSSKFRMLAPDLGETGAWGRPKTTDRIAHWPEYPIAVWERLARAKLTPDLVLIDGRFRVACFLAALLHVKPGTPILFDDYVGREKRYGLVESFAKPVSFADRMAVFEVPAEVPLVKVARALPHACLIP